MNANHIIVLDVGTTNLKCHIFSKQLKLIYKKCSEIKISNAKLGFAEINPDILWESIVSIVNECLKETGVSPSQIACLGISSHRNSFITWNRATGKPYHNFILWNDLRAKDEVRRLNNRPTFKVFKWFAYLLYLITNSSRYLTASLFRFTEVQVTGRLQWAIKKDISLKQAIEDGQAMFGTLDTWLIYRLTAGKTYCTDVSMASSTGMFDPFSSTWSTLMKFTEIPLSLLPNVGETAGHHFGETCPDIWGVSIPIKCSIADQAAALYGSKCFNVGELKITLGTGAFLDVNVGCAAMASNAGLYPLICWKYQDKLVHGLEATCYDCGTVINWLIASGLCDDMEQLTIVPKLVRDTEGVFFVSAFSGLQMPVDDPTAGTGFIGVSKNTKKKHLIKAVLDAIVFRLYDLFKLYKKEVISKFDFPINVNGGVSNNDFICQSLADICNRTVNRPQNTEMSILGVALLASQVVDCSSDSEIECDNCFQTFFPNEVDGHFLRRQYLEWQRAVAKFVCWSKE